MRRSKSDIHKFHYVCVCIEGSGSSLHRFGIGTATETHDIRDYNKE